MICTDADGNRDFCVDGENCLMPDARPSAVRDAIHRLLADPALRSRLGHAGVTTASGYAWAPRIDALEQYMFEIAQPRKTEPSTEAVPETRRR